MVADKSLNAAIGVGHEFSDAKIARAQSGFATETQRLREGGINI